MENLTAGQIELLRWLGKEDFSQYGECHGYALDALVRQGLVQIHGPGEHQVFIARGNSLMHRAVSLTDAGVSALHTLPRSPA